MAFALPLLLAALVAGSQWVTNPEDLGKAFARAQKLLAGGDFAGAQRGYEALLAVRDQPLLHTWRVRVQVDEQEVGLREAARYQLANLARRQALLARQEAALAVYRRGAEHSRRPGFQARLQAGVMSLLFEQGKYSEALAAHRLYVQAYAEQAGEAGVSLDEARFRMGECLRLLGEEAKADSLLRQAIGEYGRVLEQAGSYLIPEALYWSGYTWQVLGVADSAQVCLARVVEQAPRTELACRATLELAGLQEGAALYEQVLAQCPQGEVQALAALELARQRRLAGELAGAAAALAAIQPAQPQYLYAQLERAQLLAQEGRKAEALALLEQCQDQVQDPQDRAQIQAERGRLHLELGSAALGRQDYAAAERELRAAQQAGRRQVQAAAQYWLAHSLRAQGKLAQAQAQFAALVRQHPEQQGAAEAALLLADEAYRAGQYAAAREQYAPLFHSQEAPEALYGAAWCSLELGEEAPMEAFFQRLAREYPDSPRASEGLLALADYWYNAKDYARAGAGYQQVVDRFPRSPQAAEARTLLRFLGDLEADGLYTQAMARYDAGEYPQAIQLLQQVISRYPGTPSEAAARCNLGMAYQQLQQWDQALRQYEEAIAALAGRPGEEQALEFAAQNRAWIAAQAGGERGAP